MLETVVFMLDGLIERLLDPLDEWLLLDAEVECTLEKGVLEIEGEAMLDEDETLLDEDEVGPAEYEEEIWLEEVT